MFPVQLYMDEAIMSLIEELERLLADAERRLAVERDVMDNLQAEVADKGEAAGGACSGG